LSDARPFKVAHPIHGTQTAARNFAPDEMLLVTFQVVFESVMVELELHRKRLVRSGFDTARRRKNSGGRSGAMNWMRHFEWARIRHRPRERDRSPVAAGGKHRTGGKIRTLACRRDRCGRGPPALREVSGMRHLNGANRSPLDARPGCGSNYSAMNLLARSSRFLLWLAALSATHLFAAGLEPKPGDDYFRQIRNR